MPNPVQRAMQRVARGLFGIDFGVSGAGTYQFAQDWARATLSTNGGPIMTDRPFTQVGPFERVCSVRARDRAAVPLEFFEVDSTGEPTDEPVDGHPVSRLFCRPNQDMTGLQLLIGAYLSKDIFGEWIWYYPDLQVSRGGLRTRREWAGDLVMLHPPSVRRELKGGELRFYLRDENGIERELDRDRLTRSYRYNPYSPTHGLPLSVAIMADLGGYHAAAEWNRRFFADQQGVPTVVLKPSMQSQALQPDDREKMLRRWNQRHGSKRAVGVLPNGWEIQDLGVTQRDMDFAELRQFGRDEVLAAGGVPPLIAGYLTRPITYNASEQKEVYWESTIRSALDEEVAVLNEDFLPKIGVKERIFPKWEVVQALLENLVEKTEIASKWFGMGLSKRVINERLEMGWNPDDVPDYEESYLPFALVPASSAGLMNFDGSGGGDADDEGDDDEEGRGLRLVRDNEGARELHRALQWRQLVIRTRDLELQVDKRIRSHMEGIKREVLGNLDGAKGWLATQNKQFDELFDIEAAKRRLQKLIDPLHKAAVERGGESIVDVLSAVIDFDMQDPRVLAKLAELSHKITRIDETIEIALRDSLTQGLQAGESPQDLAARVRSVMDASKSRSFTIARTETGFAFNTGRNVGMEQAGIERHEWLSARDGKVRDTHKEVDGTVVRIGEPFPGTKLMYPLDPSGPPGEIINCRCVAVPVLENAS